MAKRAHQTSKQFTDGLAHAGINVAAATYLLGAATRILGVPADVAVPVFGTATSWYFQLAVMVLVDEQPAVGVHPVRAMGFPPARGCREHTDQPWCMDQGRGRNNPNPVRAQAVRT